MSRLRLALLFLLLIAPAASAGASQVGGRVSPDGAEELACDLPGAEHLKNTGGLGPRGPGTGAGLCVFTSLEHSGRWQNAEALRGLQQKMTHEEGGGWPEKVDKMLAKYAPDVEYVQYTGADPSLLRLALRTGRMPAVTYGYSPRYGGRVAHMVNLVHLSDKWAAVLDNNFPGEDKYEWMAPDEFLRRWKMGGGGWAVVLLAPPPPPVPINVSASDGPGEAPRPPPPGRPVIGGWGGGGCPTGGPVGPSFPLLPLLPADPEPAYEWRAFPDDDSQVALWKGGRQVGGYDFARGCYAERRPDGTWGPRGAACPVPPPEPPASFLAREGAALCGCCDGCPCGRVCRCRQRGARCRPCCVCVRRDAEEAGAEVAVQNFGLRPELIPADDRYWLNGRPVPPARARAAVARGGSLADDSGKWRLAVIGTAEECRRVTDDLRDHPALAAWKDRLLVQAYRATAWAVTGVGLPAGGHPTVVLADAPGDGNKARVLHRQDDYDGGAEALAVALRRADPSYDPRKDPDLRRPHPDAPPAGPGRRCPVRDLSAPWCAALVALAWALRRYAPHLRALAAGLRARLRPAPPPPMIDPALLARLLQQLEGSKPHEPAPPR
jgi:hypothetical protein